MGSTVAGGWIAQAAFWSLLARGWATGELGPRGVAVFTTLWIAGFLAIPTAPFGAGLFTPYVACLDVVLVILVIRGDVPLT
jgi:hypothetical protein